MKRPLAIFALCLSIITLGAALVSYASAVATRDQLLLMMRAE